MSFKFSRTTTTSTFLFTLLTVSLLISGGLSAKGSNKGAKGSGKGAKSGGSGGNPIEGCLKAIESTESKLGKEIANGSITSKKLASEYKGVVNSHCSEKVIGSASSKTKGLIKHLSALIATGENHAKGL